MLALRGPRLRLRRLRRRARKVQLMPLAYSWYRRIGDVPGIPYSTPPGIDRSKLSRADAKPSVHESRWEDQPVVSAIWPGGGSRSPAGEHMNLGGESPLTALLQRLSEALELPGTASDYHFAIMGVYQALYSRRREMPGALSEVERLCWLDISLIERCPADAGSDFDLREVGQPAFTQLISLYQREGFLADALLVAERASNFVRPYANRADPYDPRQQFHDQAEELRQRIAAAQQRNDS